MILLHRNEVFETGAVRNPAARVISVTADEALVLPAFVDETGGAAQLDTELYGAPYAIFPRTANQWLVQFRLADQDRTRTAYASWSPDQNRLDPLDRSAYESIARPSSISEAPPALRLALVALEGSLILDAVMPDGSLQSWLRGGVETAMAVRAWVSTTVAAALASDGRIVMVDNYGTHRGTINPPVPKAYFRDLAMLDGFILAVWEEDLFPNLGKSGLVIMEASLLKNEPNQVPGQPAGK